jgi:hypothetical protein
MLNVSVRFRERTPSALSRWSPVNKSFAKTAFLHFAAGDRDGQTA